MSLPEVSTICESRMATKYPDVQENEGSITAGKWNSISFVGSGSKNHGDTHTQTGNFEILPFERIPFDMQPNDLVKPQMSDPSRSLFLFPSCALTMAPCLRPEHKGVQNPGMHIPTFAWSILSLGLGRLLSREPWLLPLKLPHFLKRTLACLLWGDRPALAKHW